MIPFPGNDLPGVFGAGAAQTIMNVFGIKPGNKILMIGAGNVGLIVSYQLLQAGVEVKAVVKQWMKLVDTLCMHQSSDASEYQSSLKLQSRKQLVTPESRRQ